MLELCMKATIKERFEGVKLFEVMSFMNSPLSRFAKSNFRFGKDSNDFFFRDLNAHLTDLSFNKLTQCKKRVG